MFVSPFNSVIYNGINPNVATIPIVALPTSLFAAMRAHLKSRAALADLTDVYKNEPKRGWSYPYLVITPITGSDDIFNDEEFWRTDHLQFSVVATDDLQAEAIGEAAYECLLPVSKVRYPPLRFADGYEIVRWPTYRGRLIKQQSRGPGDVNTWIYTFGYRIETGRVA